MGRLVQISIFLGLVNAVLAFGLLRFFQGRSAEDIHAVWFLFLGTTGLFILFSVRTRDWFFSRPWPSVQVLLALTGAFVVTVALVNLPVAKTGLHFGNLSLEEQVGVIVYSAGYLVIADVMKRAFRGTHITPRRRSRV